jgi:glycosyltransferase involved in cell wall biosynthesis
VREVESLRGSYKRVSILIPSHNAEPHLKEAIESALGQTWPNKEVIVVDDGSTDDSLEIAREFANRGVVVLSQPKRGASAARNRAFTASSGAYVKYLDADDLVHTHLLEAQMERISDSDTAVASAAWGRFYNDDLSTFSLSPQIVWRDMDARDWLVESWMDARPMMQAGIFLIPRPLIEARGGWNETLSLIDDFEFFARILSSASEVRFAPGVPIYYRSGRSGTLSKAANCQAAESAFKSVLLGTGHLLAVRDDARARCACANLLQDFIYTYYPGHNDLLRKAVHRIEELGGSDLPPTGTRPFEQLCDIFGWKVAKRIQCAAYGFGYKPRPPFARPRTRGANAT